MPSKMDVEQELVEGKLSVVNISEGLSMYWMLMKETYSHFNKRWWLGGLRSLMLWWARVKER